VAPFAVATMKKYGVLASLSIAQAVLESNWGKSGLAQKGKNLFGIKGSYKGQSITMPTTEYVHGKPTKVNAKFKKYPSYQESFNDHALLFVSGVSWDRNHYKPVITAKDYKEACVQVQKCGYATDPNYSKKLIKIIEDNHLYEYDSPSSKPQAQPSKKPPSKKIKLPNVILKKGDRGENVKTLQEALCSVHFYPDKNAKNHGCDGIFGPKTEDAVKRFQSVYLPHEVDGIYGPHTREKLLKLL
jgi:murein L,D-transpeptidase YcbB/YkuD